MKIRFALGIEAASFWSEAEKDIAESPTAEPERPEKRNSELKKFKISENKKPQNIIMTF